MTVTYPAAYAHMVRGRYGDLLAADLRCAIVDDRYTPAAGHTWWSDAAATETTGPGYTTGGLPLTGLRIDTGTDGAAALHADLVLYDDAGFDARYAIVYAHTGGAPTTWPLIGYVDFDAVVNPAGDPLRIVFDDGVIVLGPPAS